MNSKVDEFFGCLDKYLPNEWGTDGKIVWLSSRFKRYNISQLTTGEVLDVYPLMQCERCGEWLDLVMWAIHEVRGK